MEVAWSPSMSVRLAQTRSSACIKFWSRVCLFSLTRKLIFLCKIFPPHLKIKLNSPASVRQLLPWLNKQFQLNVFYRASNKDLTACCTCTEGAWGWFPCTLSFSLVENRCRKLPISYTGLLHLVWVTAKLTVWITLSSFKEWLTKRVTENALSSLP